MFITGGFNAYPAEIEELLSRFEKLLYVAVIGMPDERLGEVGWAFVVPKPGAQVTESDVAQFARANMANFKVPHRIVILDDLPRNASLKVLKVQLREQARRLVEVDA
jgi:acyl-CoA synthetase (AMP-forming)/AMP-acid ligase II